jgi:glycyl-tRNA synthetase (class II)
LNRVSYSKVKKMVHEEKYMPSVIEPSFGIGRVLYSLLEHSFFQRKADEQVSEAPSPPHVCGWPVCRSCPCCLVKVRSLATF